MNMKGGEGREGKGKGGGREGAREKKIDSWGLGCVRRKKFKFIWEPYLGVGLGFIQPKKSQSKKNWIVCLLFPVYNLTFIWD
jgi:hypothetical protein